MDSAKLPPYVLFRNGRTGARYTVLQTRTVTTGEAIDAGDLTAYAVIRTLETPWWKITIAKGSRLLLSDEAAAPLIASGIIEPIMSETLVPWRNGYEADRQAKYDARKLSRG
jgi:hypothetical protein